MKKARKLGLQSLALVLMAFVLVAGVAFGMTGAWFTDTDTQNAGIIKLDNGVKMADFSLTTPTITGDRADANGELNKSATIGKEEVMPGDVLSWSFDIKKATSSVKLSDNETLNPYSDFVARLSIDVKYNDANIQTTDTKFVLSIQYKYGASGAQGAAKTVANGASNLILGKDAEADPAVAGIAVTDSKYYTVTVSLTLVGQNFRNADELKAISLAVTVDAIQAANYAEGNWASHTMETHA